LNLIARACVRLGVSANALTFAGLVAGLAAALLLVSDAPRSAVAVLWLSGLLDAADGTLARMTRPSALGAIMDVTVDRVVEVSVILALAWRYPDARLALLLLTAVIVVAMSLFLSIGAALANSSAKSFHYAPGFAERTEGFIFLSLMSLNASHLASWSLLFAAAIVFTMGQRVRDVRAALSSAASKAV
jgi:phosphatidylglycerophosphate synthase